MMDSLYTSARNEDHIELLIKWFEAGFIHDLEGKKLDHCELSKVHKHSLMKRIWSSQKQTLETKQKLMAQLAKIDQSDWLDQTEKVCTAALPENKRMMWDAYFSDDKEGMCAKWGLENYRNSFGGWNQV